MGSVRLSDKRGRSGEMSHAWLILLVLIILDLFACDGANEAPDCNFTVEPAYGNLATVFYFDGTPTQDEDNLYYSLLYRWDYNSDQIWDSYYSHDPKGAYKFSKSGRYTVTLEVKDPQGNISQSSVIVTVTDENQPPVAELLILPPRATTGTTVILDGSQSSDDLDDAQDLLFRWDVYSDGLWETGFSRNQYLIFNFDQEGIFTVTLEVKDSREATHSVSSGIEVLKAICPYSFLIDPRDQHFYSTVKIGKFWIMAQNLQYGTFAKSSVTPMNNGICEYFGYNDLPQNVALYGGLYLWDEVLDYTDKEKGRGICPPGWHLPSEQEWQDLETEMGMDVVDIVKNGYERGEGIGSLLKENSLSGFEAGLWGWRFHERTFYGMNLETRFWTSTVDPQTGQVYVRGLASHSTGIFRGTIPNNSALAVRCFKD